MIASSDALAGLHRTPVESPVKDATTISINARFTELGALEATLELTAKGDSEWPLRAAFRETSQADWTRVLQFLSRAWGLPGDVSDIHVDTIENTAKPFHLTYHVHKADYFKVPNSAANFQLLPPVSGGRVPKASRKHASEPLDVGPAEERTYRVHVEFPANFTVHVPSDVSVTRDFGEYTSSYKLSKNVLDAERRMVLKVNELPAFRRADYESFHNVTTTAVEESPWCSITRPSASALAAAAELKGTPAELREAGQAALKRQDFTTAAALLQRAHDQDPLAKEGWEDLGHAYAGLSQHDKAAQAFQKQVETDPYSAHANAELAGELQQLGRSEDAIAAYRKQIEITPSEKSSHKQLGLLLAELKRDQDARVELETAASFPPEDPEVRMALAQVYSRLGETGKARTIMASLTGSSGSAGGADLFAGALRDDVDPNQAVHDAEKDLNDIGDQFDSGEYDHPGSSAFSAMDLVALSWARLGWARFLLGDTLSASQFLDVAWNLSQSGTVGNRLAQVYEKTGARDRARHMFALAAAAGGQDSQASRQAVMRLASNTEAADKEIAQATFELQKMRALKLAGAPAGSASAQFALVFDNSDRPERIEFLGGDVALRDLGNKLQDLEYAVKFPDVSSIKIIREGNVTCSASECTVSLQPLEHMQPAPQVIHAGAAPQPAAVIMRTGADSSSHVVTGPGVAAPGSDITTPRAISSPDPDYPEAARRAKKQGVVIVAVVVGTDGRVHDAHVVQSLRSDLDESAMQAVREWRFEPATKDGKPVEVQVKVEVSFHLYKDAPEN